MKTLKSNKANKITKEIKFKNPNAPATINQRLLLRRLTGVVNTGKPYTMRSIGKAIDEARNNPPTKKTTGKIVTLKIGNKTVKAQILS